MCNKKERKENLMFDLFSSDSLWNEDTAMSAMIVSHEDLIDRIRNFSYSVDFDDSSLEEFKATIESVYPEANDEVFDYEWKMLYKERLAY